MLRSLTSKLRTLAVLVCTSRRMLLQLFIQSDSLLNQWQMKHHSLDNHLDKEALMHFDFESRQLSRIQDKQWWILLSFGL